jgi:predicted HicB family RNase H-like nuclease
MTKQTETKTERLDLRVTQKLKKRLTEKAKQLSVSRNQLVEDVLIAFLDR